jgi:transmembrane sensor
MTHAPVSRDLVAEASAWFVEFRDGNVPDSTRARFNDWLRRSPEHIQAYLEVSAAWSELPTSDPQHRIDVEALIARARASAEGNVVGFEKRRVTALSDVGAPVQVGSDGSASQVARRDFRRRALFAAAAVVVAIALGIGLWQASLSGVYSTGVGEQRTVLLADGSTIELNALSKVRVRLSKEVRDIELTEGQAFFHVAKDRARPFIVRSGAATVRAVGTQFDVYRRSVSTTVTVLEGEVAVLPGDSPDTRASGTDDAATDRAQPDGAPAILLSAGDQLTVTPHQVSKRKKADVAAATSWTEHRLIFEATPLSDVADEFNRYNRKKLIIADAALRSLGISGVYSSADPESLLGFLRAQPTLIVTETADEIRVTRREKP